MAALFAHSKHIRKRIVCWQQLDDEGEAWHTANMRLKIKELRKARGWTVDVVASRSGLSRGYISQLQNEKRQPSADTLTALAFAFEVELPELIDSGELSDDLSAMYEIMKAIPAEDRRALLRAAAGLLPQRKEEVA